MSQSTESEWTDATKVSQKTVRVTYVDAMAEERCDAMKKFFLWEKRLLNTKEHIKSAKDYLEEFGSKRIIIDTPITEHGFAGIATGASIRWTKAYCRVYDIQFRHAGNRSNCKLCR